MFMRDIAQVEECKSKACEEYDAGLGMEELWKNFAQRMRANITNQHHPALRLGDTLLSKNKESAEFCFKTRGEVLCFIQNVR